MQILTQCGVAARVKCHHFKLFQTDSTGNWKRGNLISPLWICEMEVSSNRLLRFYFIFSKKTLLLKCFLEDSIWHEAVPEEVPADGEIPAVFMRVVLSCDRCVVANQHLTAAAFSQTLSPFLFCSVFKIWWFKSIFSLQSPRRPAPTCHRSGSPGRRGAGLWSGSGAAAEALRSPAAPSWEKRCLGWPRCGCS